MKRKAVWRMVSIGVSIYPFWWGVDWWAGEALYMLKLGPIRVEVTWPVYWEGE